MDYTLIEQFKDKLKKELKKERYEHTLRTVLTAMELTLGTDADRDKVFVASLLHDCAKYRTPTKEQAEEINEFAGFEKIIHAPLGAIIARDEYGIRDKTVLNAIKYHTTGRKNMTAEEKIVCLADAIEDGRNYLGVEEIRKMAKTSVDNGLIAYFENVIGYEKNSIHPLSIEALEDIKSNKGGQCK